MGLVYLNGEFKPIEEASINVLDRGFTFGDGNYDVIPIFKKGIKQFEKNVRLKLMEKCESLINPNQHGFLPKKSCTTQLVTFTDSLALSLNSNYRVDTIYFDFMKDSILLCKELESSLCAERTSSLVKIIPPLALLKTL